MNRDIPVRAYRKATRTARGRAYALLIRAAGGSCGPGFEVDAGTTFRYGPHSGLSIGANVRLGRGVIIDLPAGSNLVLGDGVKIMHYTVVAGSESITIGAGTQIGESCSIRDADHGPGNDELPMAQHLITTPTIIGADVWIARGVAVLRGSEIGDGAVVGANSVVVARYPVPAKARVVGAPAKPAGVGGG